MGNRDIFGAGSSWGAALDIHSNLARSGVYDMVKNVSEILGTNMEHIKVLDGATSMLAKTAGIMKMDYAGIIDKANYAGIIDRINDIGGISRITEMSGAVGAIEKSGIFELSSAMKAWKASVTIIPNDFSDEYNSIIKDSVKSITSGIRTIDYNNLDNSFLETLRPKDFTGEKNKIKEEKIDYNLESNADSQKVKAMIKAEVEDIELAIKEHNGDVIVAINKLTEVVAKVNPQKSLLDTIVQSIMSIIAERFVKSLFHLMPLIITFANLNAPVAINNNYIIKEFKKEIRVMDFNNDFYNTFRIVSKDGLEVMYSNKMKSGVKYYLVFGDLVEIEHKNKNWTKISYTNKFTDVREIGWVLTRYIERLD